MTTSLADLVTHDSWFLFHLLGIKGDFLSQPVNIWANTPEYTVCLKKLKGVTVVNDAAECGVKLSSDFLRVAKSEQHYQNTLQVVEQNRKTKSSLGVKNNLYCLNSGE